MNEYIFINNIDPLCCSILFTSRFTKLLNTIFTYVVYHISKSFHPRRIFFSFILKYSPIRPEVDTAIGLALITLSPFQKFNTFT